ncbi:MAG: hypothetical protein JWM86_191, partial [Thermoleophilia bacterium]|nr:hypothetical protein [Thermoleophilia bacterium]
MASINPTTPSSNAQLTGITGTVPMPRGSITLADGTQFQLAPGGSFSLGGSTGGNFTIVPDTVGQPPAAGTSGQVIVGGGSTPPGSGAQPPAPGTTVAAGGLPPTAATTTVAPTTTTAAANPTTASATGAAATVSGFGKAERGSVKTAAVGDAKFSFPSFKASAKSNTAPAITWGPDWKRVEKNGMFYMEHSNGTKAIPAVEFRVTPSPAEKVQTVKVANGWGKKFPDGTILVFDRNEGAYRLDAKGNKVKLPLGTHTFGGVKVRVFEASVVRTLEPNGIVNVFTSRGQHTPGTTRGHTGAAVGNANAGAAATGGGAPGKAPEKAPGTTVGSGPTQPSPADMTKNVEKITAAARQILDQIKGGNVDPAKLAELQAQLGALPAGILQAAGAAGTITSDGRTLRHDGHTDATTTTPSTTTPNTPPAAGTTVAAGSSTGGGAAPVAGNDANATTKAIASSTKFSFDDLPQELRSKQARFGQLPQAVQDTIATKLGSNQGSAALKADQLIAFDKDGGFSIPGGATAFIKHQSQIRGAGPGEDLAMTVRPSRQPGDARPAATTSGNRTTTVPGTTTGGGASTSHGTHGTSTGSPSAPRPVVTVGGGPMSQANRIKLFAPGASIRSIDFGGLNGSFTWKTLPKKAQDAILAYLKTEKADPASKAFSARTGSGWTFDPNAVIVLDAGFASFVGGMSMTRGAARPAAGATGGGAPASGGATGSASSRPPV